MQERFHSLFTSNSVSVSLACKCSWRAATGSPSTAWRACVLSFSPPQRRSTICRWPTPATTCSTCPATRPKRSCAAASLRLWSSTRVSAWSEGRRSAAVLMHFNSNTPPCQCQKSVMGESGTQESPLLYMLLQDCWIKRLESEKVYVLYVNAEYSCFNCFGQSFSTFQDQLEDLLKSDLWYLFEISQTGDHKNLGPKIKDQRRLRNWRLRCFIFYFLHSCVFYIQLLKFYFSPLKNSVKTIYLPFVTFNLLYRVVIFWPNKVCINVCK